MSYRYELTPHELSETFRDFVEPRWRPLVVTSTKPELILLGGQPASGKTRAAQLIKQDDRFNTQNFFTPEGDALRAAHPDYEQVRERDPLKMPEVTSQASGAWLGMLVKLGFDQRSSMLIEGTWRNSRVPLEALERAKELGYRTHAVLLAVPEQVSRLDMLERYYDLRVAGGAARWTPPSAHDEAITNLQATAEALAAHEQLDTFSVITRSGDFLLDREASSHQRGANVLRALNQARHEHWNLQTQQSWHETAVKNFERHLEFTEGTPEADAVWEQILNEDMRHISSARSTSPSALNQNTTQLLKPKHPHTSRFFGPNGGNPNNRPRY